MKTIRSIVVTLTVLNFVMTISAAGAKTEIGPLLQNYFEVQHGLAADSLAAAQAAAAAIVEMPSVADGLGEVATAANAVAEASDIATARVEFQELSTQVLAVVEEVGTEDGVVFLARCPMAFTGKGGTWLQDDRTIANPYYGSKMLRCGGVIKEIGKDPAMDASHAHDKH